METKHGLLGTAITLASWLCGFLAQHKAELQAASFVVSILVGIPTAIWWWIKLWRSIFGKDRKDG